MEINQYESGEYWIKNSDLHEEDSDFKFENFIALLNRNPQLKINGIADVGCGAGRLIWNFSKKYPSIQNTGVDLDERIISYANTKYTNNNLTYHSDFQKIKKNSMYNLALIADVFEHIEDYISFLKDINQNFTYHLFNIPLDLSIKSLFFNGPIKTRNSVSHLHYFYDKLILQILEENGFRIIDYLYADNVSFALNKKSGLRRVLYLGYSVCLRIFVFFFGKPVVSRLFGCYSLTVLCSNKSAI